MKVVLDWSEIRHVLAVSKERLESFFFMRTSAPVARTMLKALNDKGRPGIRAMARKYLIGGEAARRLLSQFWRGIRLRLRSHRAEA